MTRSKYAEELLKLGFRQSSTKKDPRIFGDQRNMFFGILDELRYKIPTTLAVDEEERVWRIDDAIDLSHLGFKDKSEELNLIFAVFIWSERCLGINLETGVESWRTSKTLK